jgi:hypothetical protein
LRVRPAGGAHAALIAVASASAALPQPPTPPEHNPSVPPHPRNPPPKPPSAIEMSGFLELKCEILRGGMDQYLTPMGPTKLHVNPILCARGCAVGAGQPRPARAGGLHGSRTGLVSSGGRAARHGKLRPHLAPPHPPPLPSPRPLSPPPAARPAPWSPAMRSISCLRASGGGGGG